MVFTANLVHIFWQKRLYLPSRTSQTWANVFLWQLPSWQCLWRHRHCASRRRSCIIFAWKDVNCNELILVISNHWYRATHTHTHGTRSWVQPKFCCVGASLVWGMFFYLFYVHTKFPIIVTNSMVHYIIGLAGMLLSYCHTCRVGTAGVHLGGESPMPEYSAGWLETKRGSNVICKHMRILSLKTVRCEVVFTHLVCPTPCVVADMKRQVGILQVCQPLCIQFLTVFRLWELKKAFVAPIFVMTLSLLIETAESFALWHSYLSTYASRHHMCSRRSLAPAATMPTTSHGIPSLVSFVKE